MVCKSHKLGSLPLAALAENPPRLDTLVATRMVRGPQAEAGQTAPGPSLLHRAVTPKNRVYHRPVAGALPKLRPEAPQPVRWRVARLRCSRFVPRSLQPSRRNSLTGGIPPAERTSLSPTGLLATFGSKRVGENISGQKLGLAIWKTSAIATIVFWISKYPTVSATKRLSGIFLIQAKLGIPLAERLKYEEHVICLTSLARFQTPGIPPRLRGIPGSSRNPGTSDQEFFD